MNSQENTKSEVSAMVASPKGGGREGAIKVGIIGGAGYTGGELIRLLLNHPDTDISFIHSRSNSGKPVSSIHQDLLGETDLLFSNELKTDVDVLFLCVGHGEAKKFGLVDPKIRPGDATRRLETGLRRD